jgi:hypothetical protein
MTPLRLTHSSLHGSLYMPPVTMENVCCHRNVLTEPLANDGLVRCCVNMCLESCWVAVDVRSGSTIPAFRPRITVCL